MPRPNRSRSSMPSAVWVNAVALGIIKTLMHPVDVHA
jgi:hypothetical protein